MKESFLKWSNFIPRNMTLILCRIIFLGASSKKFTLGVCLGLSFSISIILGTIGLMDGFEYVLKKGLRHSLGDIYFYSENGFFYFSDKLTLKFNELGIKNFSPYIQTEAFAIKGKHSRGVSVLGVKSSSFSKTTGLNIELEADEAAIGIELAKTFDLKIGQTFVLALAKGNRSIDNLPLFKHYRVKSIIQHRIYQKDLRLVYVDLKGLSKVLNVEKKVNIVALKMSGDVESNIENSDIQNFIFRLKNVLGSSYKVRPYWHEYETLLEAVRIEKLTIGLVFQIVVIVSIFNVLAFITFLNEKRRREFFLLRALGLSQKGMMEAWFKMAVFLWLVSCFLSIGMVAFFDWALKNWSLFLLPKDVYYLERFSLILSWDDYFLVFFLALAWLIFFITINFWKFREKSFIHGLRKEFI